MLNTTPCYMHGTVLVYMGLSQCDNGTRGSKFLYSISVETTKHCSCIHILTIFTLQHLIPSDSVFLYFEHYFFLLLQH